MSSFGKAALAAAVASAFIALPVSAASFDMEAVAPGAYSSLVLTDDGLTLTVTTDGLPSGYILAKDLSIGLLGHSAILGSKTNFDAIGNWTPMRFSFDHAIDSITFNFGDGGGDSDTPVIISAYTAGGIFLGSTTDNYPNGYGSGTTRTLNFAGASYFVTYSGTDQGNENSLGWDISSVTPSGAVPEPASWAMMLAGFGAVGGALRSRRRIALVIG